MKLVLSADRLKDSLIISPCSELNLVHWLTMSSPSMKLVLKLNEARTQC